MEGGQELEDAGKIQAVIRGSVGILKRIFEIHKNLGSWLELVSGQ